MLAVEVTAKDRRRFCLDADRVKPMPHSQPSPDPGRLTAPGKARRAVVKPHEARHMRLSPVRRYDQPPGKAAFDQFGRKVQVVSLGQDFACDRQVVLLPQPATCAPYRPQEPPGQVRLCFWPSRPDGEHLLGCRRPDCRSGQQKRAAALVQAQSVDETTQTLDALAVLLAAVSEGVTPQAAVAAAPLADLAARLSGASAAAPIPAVAVSDGDLMLFE